MVDLMKRLALAVVMTLALLSQAGTQEIKLFRPDPNDPGTRRAMIALARAVKAAGLGQVRFAVAECNCGAAYLGHMQFVVDRNVLGLTQWMFDALMAHEAGHALRRHVETSQALSSGVVELFGLLGGLLSNDAGSGGETGKTVGKIAVGLTLPKFTQSQEYDADAIAVTVLRREGYRNPGDVMAATLGNLGGVGGGWFNSYPSTPDRIRRLRGRK